jgi:hypothetical protein
MLNIGGVVSPLIVHLPPVIGVPNLSVMLRLTEPAIPFVPAKLIASVSTASPSTLNWAFFRGACGSSGSSGSNTGSLLLSVRDKEIEAL